MANFWRFETKKTICQPLKIFQNFPSKFQKNFFFQNCQFWLLTADFGNMCMKLNFMNTHRVVQNSLEPYRSSKSSQKQSKSADMAQTGYAIEKVTRTVNCDSWQLVGMLKFSGGSPKYLYWHIREKLRGFSCWKDQQMKHPTSCPPA